MKWKFVQHQGSESIILNANPISVVEAPQKYIEYDRLISGREVRLLTPVIKQLARLTLKINYVDINTKRKIMEWFNNDIKFIINRDSNGNMIYPSVTEPYVLTGIFAIDSIDSWEMNPRKMYIKGYSTPQDTWNTTLVLKEVL